MESIAQKQHLPSSVYEWKIIPAEISQEGEKRRFFNCPNKTLGNFEIFMTTYWIILPLQGSYMKNTS
jgi:hypothetical protein